MRDALPLGERPKQRRPLRRIAAALLLVAGLWLVMLITRVGAPADVSIQPELPGLGKATPIAIEARAPGRGLVGLRVEVEQNGRVAVLDQRSFEPRPYWAFWGQRTERDQLLVDAGSESVDFLEEGTAKVRVVAERASTPLRRPAPSVTELELPVRLRPPTVSLLSDLIYVAQGGSEAVVYSVTETAVRDGVRAGSAWFPGYPLPGGRSSDRFAFFAVPYDLDDEAQVRLVAADDLGNESTKPFVDRFTAKALRRSTIRLSDSFFGRVLPEIYAQSSEIRETGDALQDYLQVNGELRRINAVQLRELSKQTTQDFLWSRPFLQLPNSQVMDSFAARRTYLYNGEEVDIQVHLGFDLATVRRDEVPAANRGRVLLARYLGIYGNSVVLDHGYGLMTLYSHLSSIEVEVDQTVERGQVVGHTGATGLAGGDHLHFTVLLHGEPVTPVEWFDPKWIEDRLVRKLGNALAFSRS